jgi:hypothetical protein
LRGRDVVAFRIVDHLVEPVRIRRLDIRVDRLFRLARQLGVGLVVHDHDRCLTAERGLHMVVREIGQLEGHRGGPADGRADDHAAL